MPAMPRKLPTSELDRHAGLRLRALRDVWDEFAPIKQETFAAKMGVARTALANWEGGRLPDIRAMIRLNAWINIPLEWIYLGDLRHVERDLAKRLEIRCAQLGAHVKGADPIVIAAVRARRSELGEALPLAPRRRCGGPHGFHEQPTPSPKPEH